ncbi:MAG: hypothetical protein J7J80_02700, partial [Thermotogae bacterium]|nr:hypothetical protein [Thermotogota bacterium]
DASAFLHYRFVHYFTRDSVVLEKEAGKALNKERVRRGKVRKKYVWFWFIYEYTEKLMRKEQFTLFLKF